VDKPVRDLINTMQKEHGDGWAFELLMEFAEMGEYTSGDFRLYSSMWDWIEKLIYASQEEVQDGD